MSPTGPACPLDVSEQTLSAALDGLLDPAERATLERHVAGCVACQRRLASLQQVARVLRDQREPQLTAQVWRGLQARIASPAARRPAILRGRIPGRIPTAALTTVAATLIIALFAAALVFRGNHPNGSGSVMATPTTTSAAQSTATSAPQPTASPTGPTASVSVPAGWTKAAIPDGFLSTVAFAPSSPRIAYAVSMVSGAAAVSSSSDGGATWQTLGRPALNQNRCQIAVDPTDASDVALACTPAASSGFTILRSFDGARTWTRPAISVSVNCYGNMGFAGSTLLMAFSLCDSMSSQTQLFASVNKGSFKRLDTDGKVSGITLGAQIRLITGHGSTVYLQMGNIQYNPPQLADSMLVSHDAGATWQTATFSDNGASVHLLAVDPLDRIWVGAYASAPKQLALSSDGGQNWRKLPPPWANEMGPDFLFVAPDGTVLVTDARATYTSYTSPTFTLYEATPGATQWAPALLIPQPGSIFGQTAGWDSGGHPTSLWASYATGEGSGPWYLISHPLAG
ncbi:MAG TPA: zf-HC2 domain-containing protein [Ktedonobacterales bacterium]